MCLIIYIFENICMEKYIINKVKKLKVYRLGKNICDIYNKWLIILRGKEFL